MEETVSQDAKQGSGVNLPTQKAAFQFDPRELVPEPLFCCDTDGWILWTNRAAEQLLGRPAHELIGHSFAQLFHPQDRTRLAFHFVREHRRAVTESYCEAPLLSASGRSHWAGLRVRLLRGADNGPRVYVCSAHDLQAIHSELEELRRKVQGATARADEAAAAAELKSEFLTTTSQELRVPMTGVIGMSRLLLESELDREQRMYAEVIQNSAESLLALVDDVLDYARIEAAKLELQNIAFDLRVAIDATAGILASRASAKDLGFELGVNHRVPSLLIGDPARMRQVVTSLASNTIQFAERGEVSLRIELTEETAQAVTVRFLLRAGKDPDPEGKTARLLRAFAGDDSALAREFGSRGLGLSISRRLVALMGGRVGASYDVDHGITVWIDLPFVKQSERNETPLQATVDLTGIRVLVVGSTAGTSSELVQNLTTLGCLCSEKENADGALETLTQAARNETPYHLAFVDYDPSGFDPGTLARSIREDKSLDSTNLILTTIIGRQGDAAQAESWGYLAYLVMPLERESLRQVMEEVLRRSFTDFDESASTGSRLITRHSVAEQRRQRLRVLVVEDNPIDQLVISAAMHRMGYEPVVVRSGNEALETFRQQPFDVIFLDLVMPDVSGWEVASIIRKEEDEERRTPIIATTVLDSEEDRARCREAGMDDYLTKPLDFEAMAATIEHWARVAKEQPISSTTATSPSSSADETPSDTSLEIVRLDEALPVIDTARLEVTCMGNEELRTRMTAAFSTHTQAAFERLESAIEGGDAAAVEIQSHALRGMCVSIGASRCAVLFERLESAAREGGSEGWQALHKSAKVELARATEDLSQRERAA